MPTEWKTNTLGLISIALTLLAFVNKDSRLLTGTILTGAIVFYIINSFSADIDEYGKKIGELEKNLKFHEQLINLKSDIEYLKKEVSRI